MAYMLGLAHGCWVVSYSWVQECLAHRRWVPEKNYQVKVRVRAWGGGACCGAGPGPASCRLRWVHEKSFQVRVRVRAWASMHA